MIGLIDQGAEHIIFNMTRALRQGGLTRKQRRFKASRTFLSYRRNASISVSSARGPARQVCATAFGISISSVLRTF
jgi:hypothetical protein